MRNPIYTSLGTLVCLYLAAANARGWSFMKQISPAHWISSGRGVHK